MSDPRKRARIVLKTEPLIYPSRHEYPFTPGIPDRQLWAIGMIVIQWSMTEMIRGQHIENLIDGDAALEAEYQNTRSAKRRNELWKAQIESKLVEPERAIMLALVTRVEMLNEQRDQIIHRVWAGGSQQGAWNAPPGETTDSVLMKNQKELENDPARGPAGMLRWHATFDRLRQVAREMATLNRDLMFWMFHSVPPRAS